MMTRRTFLKNFGFISSILLFFGQVPKLLWAGKWEHSRKSFWKKKRFFQKTVDVSHYKDGIIRARIDGQWQEFKIRETNKAFIKWNLKSRIEFLEQIKTGKMPGLAGPHSGAVATYGLGRLDSKFTVNNAIKGIGLAPKDEYLDKAIRRLEETYKEPMPRKMDVLKSFYEDENFIDWRKQTSLELYSTPDFETHTFLNVMENPVATIVFCDIPCFELRTIVHIVHPEDETALDSEKKLLKFVNLAHSYMHGEFSKQFPLLLFYIIEEFDNTPGSKRGIRVMPKRPAE